VSVLDGANNRVTATVTVGSGPEGVGVDPSTDIVYVANAGAGTVSLIDAATDAVTATVTVGSGPIGVGVDVSTDTVYVADDSARTVSVIDGRQAPTKLNARPGPDATPGVGEVDLSWSAPGGSGSTVTGYVVTARPACPRCAGLTSARIATTVNGLTPGTSYTFTVSARYADGTGPASSASKPIDVFTVPSAPRFLVVQATLAGSAAITFSPPATNGGESVTGYVVSASPACLRCSGMTTTATSTTITGLASGRRYSFSLRAANKAGSGPSTASSSPVLVELEDGYWLAARGGTVFGLGSAASLGGIRTTSSDPVVGIAGSPDGKGYFVATADGDVTAFGDVTSHGDLSTKHIARSDVVAIVTTQDANGYWLIGADGEVYSFGDATFYGDLLHLQKPVHVTNVVGMVPSLGDRGYFLLGSDGGVFAFGSTHFYGSLPGIGVKVDNIRGILPSATGKGYVLVGSDGGAFVFGSGVRFFGSLPGRHIKVDDIVGLALTPDDGGYYMAAASTGAVYGFGDGKVFASPRGLGSNLPIAAIAGV
jgi:YVTN family beta-propeller protein